MNNNNADMYNIDSEEIARWQKENKPITEGVYCPKRNKEISKPCKACDRVQSLFSSGDKEDRKIALDKMAKSNYYANVVLPENPNVRIVLEIPKKCGDGILNGIRVKGWNDIANPFAGRGRLMLLTKTKGDLGFNQYSADPILTTVDWDVPQEILDNIPNIIDNPIEVIEAAGDSLLKASSLKVDEKIKFRLLPWSKDASRHTVLGVIYKHWGVSQDEVDGIVEMDLTTTEERIKKAEESKGEQSLLDKEPVKQSEPEPKEPIKSEPTKLACFGKDNFYDSDDKDCQKCASFKSCGKVVINSK